MQFTKEQLLAEKAKREKIASLLLKEREREKTQFPISTRAMEGNILRQSLAGILPGLASVGDIPAALFNLGSMGGDYLTKKITGNKDYESVKLPYVFHDTATKAVDKVFGEPKTEGEESARMLTEIGSGFLNPMQVGRGALNLIPKPAKIAAKLTKFSPEKYEALDKAGLMKTLGSTSDSVPVIMAEEGMRHLPFSSNNIMKIREGNVNELDNLFLKEANIRPGKAGEIQTRADLITKGNQAYNNNAKSVANKLYEKGFQNTLKPETAIPMETTLKTIDNSLETFSDEARKILEKSGAGNRLVQLKDAITKNKTELISEGGDLYKKSKGILLPSEAVAKDANTLHYQDIKQIFKPFLNDLIDTWGQIGPNDQRILKNVVDAMNKDIRNYVTKIDPKAERHLTLADKFWANFSKRERQIANKGSIQTDPLAQFNSVYTRLLRGDTEPYKIATKHLADSEKSIFNAELNTELGLNKNKEFDPFTWARNFNKLRSPAQNAALSTLPKSSADKLKSVAKSFENFQNAAQYGNHSRSAYYGALGAWVLHALQEPVSAAGIAASQFGASKLFTNQKLIDAMYAASKAGTTENLNKIIAKFEPEINKIQGISAAPIGFKENPQDIKDQQSLEQILNRFSREELLAEKARRQALKQQSLEQISTEEPKDYAKGGKVIGGHYNQIRDEIVDIATKPINASNIKTIRSWLERFCEIHDLYHNKEYKEAYNYASKIKNKGQITILLNYINKIPNISKKKLLEIRKAFITAKSKG